jgi:hypothetical protein
VEEFQMSLSTQSSEEKLASQTEAPLAAEITVDGVTEPDGFIPLPLLISGTTARIQRWEETSFDDHLEVFWLQDGNEELLFERRFPTGIVPPEIEVTIPPSRMAVNGTALLYYIITAFGMPDPSPRKPLIIDHTQEPEKILAEAIFTNLTKYGYYNCETDPALTSGIVIDIPKQPWARPGDQFSLKLQGYRTLNGSPGENGEHIVPESAETLTRFLNDQEIENGFSQSVSFAPCIKPLIDEDSLVAIYTITRAGRVIGKSRLAVAKIDRILSGSTYCYS